MSDTPRTDEYMSRAFAGTYNEIIALADFARQLERELAAERERADRNEKDAERYRWLAMHRALIVPEYGEEILRGNAIRVAIDAAMKGER